MEERIKNLAEGFSPQVSVKCAGRLPELELSLPGSKSLTARAMIAASMAAGISRISNAAACEDTDNLKNSLLLLGIDIRERECLEITVAVEILFTKKGFPSSGRARMRAVPDASAPSLIGFIQDHVEKGTTVITDEWKGYLPLSRYGYDHDAIKIGDPKEASVKFPRVHRVISNLKAWLNGTHRFASPKHIQNYLNEFVFRFNRRNLSHEAFRGLMRIAVQTRPPYLKELLSDRPKYKNGKSALGE